MKKLQKLLVLCIMCLIVPCMSGCGDSDIDMVKDGTLSFDSSISLGDAFEGNQAFSNVEWEAFEDTQKRKYVQVSADVDMSLFQEGTAFPVKLIVQFKVNKDGTFETTYMTYKSELEELFTPSMVADVLAELQVIYKNSVSQRALNLISTKLRYTLENAIRENKVDIVKFYIDSGADIGNGNKPIILHSNRAPLAFASANGSLEIVKMLLDAGADVNANKSNALLFAIANKRYDIIKELIKNGAEVHEPHLQHIQGIDDLEMLKLIIQNISNVNAETSSKYLSSALFDAVWNENLEKVKFYIKNGADVNAHTGEYSVLKAALTKKNFDMIELIVKSGADVNAKGRSGTSALDYAKSSRFDEKIINLLQSQ